MKDWQDFIHLQKGDLKSSNFICDVNQLGLILVTGDEAQSFLQNQLSNDITQIDETRFQLSSYSTPKGRLLVIFRIIAISNGYILIMPASLVSTILKRLQMYVLHARVSLADASDHFARFAIQTDIGTVIDHHLLAQNEGQVVQSDTFISLQLSGLNKQRRYLVFSLSAEAAQSLWSEFTQHLDSANFESWRLSEIKSGIAVVYPETSEEFVLQMANLDLIDGVNFKKGCYPGQEIVARMHYLGKLKRRLFLARLKTALCPRPGDDICSKSVSSPDGSGKVVDAIVDESGICHCLYIAQIKKTNANELCLLSQPRVAFNPVDLPYPVS